MKVKKQLVAATLAVGLAGSAGAVGPVDDSMNAQAGFAIAYYAFNNNPATQAFAQGAAGAAGGIAGAAAGRRAGAWLGARVGASVGAMFGPGGAILGAGIGAL